MPTIKTQNGKVITKLVGDERRVSCSCCESAGVCCMYPSGEYDDSYVFDDLPDSLLASYVFESETYTATLNKESSPIAITDATQFYSGTLVGSGAYSGETLRLIRQDPDIVFSGEPWLFDTDMEGWSFLGSLSPSADGNNCLISYEDPPTIEDEFESEYEIDFFGTSLSVYRVSLCVWRTEIYPIEGDSGTCPPVDWVGDIAELYYNETNNSWSLTVVSGTWVDPEDYGFCFFGTRSYEFSKTTLSDPTGEYIGDDGNITVSAP